MNIELFLTIFIWWAVGFASDVATVYAIDREYKWKELFGSIVVGCLGFVWALLCFMGLQNRYLNGSDDDVK